MARIIAAPSSHSQESPFSFTLKLFLSLLSLMAILGVVLAAMGRQKTTVPTTSAKFRGKGKGKSPADLEDEAEEAADRRKKRKEDEADKDQRQWASKLKSRKFTCERQVDRRNMGNHPIVTAIVGNGLDALFREVRGYRKKLVLAFYEHMTSDPHAKTIESFVGNVPVLVTPSRIATYLGGYNRPRYPTFPRFNWPISDGDVINDLVENVDQFDAGSGLFSAGGLKELPRIANKVVHYNLSPRTIEKTPTMEDGRLLYAFCTPNETVDWALYIWEDMFQFRARGVANANIPFPAMITAFCLQDGCRESASDPLIQGSPGPITHGSIKKSKSLSKPPAAHDAGPSQPKSKKPSQRTEEWFTIMNNQQQTIIQEQRQIRADQVVIRKDQGRIVKKQSTMMKILRWLVCQEESRSNVKYRSADEVSEEEEQEDEEDEDDSDEE